MACTGIRRLPFLVAAHGADTARGSSAFDCPAPIQSADKTGPCTAVSGLTPNNPNIEFVRSGGWWKSFPIAFHGLRRKSNPIANHFFTFCQASVALGTFGAIAGSPLTEPLALVMLGYSAACFALTSFHKPKKMPVGHFELMSTIAGHAYEVFSPAQQTTIGIEPLDDILEIHINNSKLRATISAHKEQTGHTVLENIFEQEMPVLLTEVQNLLKTNPRIKALRLSTPLHPKYFEWAKDFLIHEVHLSSAARAKPSRLKSLFARLIFESATQLHTLTMGRWIRFNVQKDPRKLLKQPHPMRTYVIPASNVATIAP